MQSGACESICHSADAEPLEGSVFTQQIGTVWRSSHGRA
jgi:hypothetical protein